MLQYSTRPLPASWPGKLTPSRARKRSPFKSNWGGTIALLEREIRQLNGKDVAIAIGVREQDLRIDGGVRANARVQNPAVIVSFTAGADRLSFPCDRFQWWEENVRAIALALEALRKVDRYGVQSGKQYLGFKALPGSNGSAPPTTPEAAAMCFSEWSEGTWSAKRILADAGVAKEAYRYAAKLSHPDGQDGSTEAFQGVQDARAVLSTHHGVSL